MLLKPFAISELSDPSQVRVVFYSGERFVHAPLNGVLELLKADLKSEFESKIRSLEERLEVLSTELEELKQCDLDGLI
ncbi:hypothetical protein ME1_00822 [Bartonella vinsonii subsp. arupensis OK-94-513]|uniref:Uncharacterized protein n=1 Tax=Bartonella vinsonii subsp. arupensis OK-94-513 TaxID=1094562 RepID=J0ZIL8_BARVI|nr:hypothetical protein [Bartonella vinsonii]EJF88058.1 hypothetical protein ME1_00822 [Bartonella vinsonii subsp. arupensis OK-94-513]